MKYASTLAMATHLLAEGRVGDVVRMVEPLIEQSSAEFDSDAEPGTLRLHALWAQVLCTARLDPNAAQTHLPAQHTELNHAPTRARAEVALWNGWVDVLKGTSKDVLARALARLDAAERLFESVLHQPGRYWVLIGRAQAYFALDEYHLMRHTLDEAQALGTHQQHALGRLWLHDLQVPALRFQGHYDKATQHVEQLKETAHSLEQSRWVGHAQAQEAALAYDQGAAPDVIVERATTAETRLQGTTNCRPYPLLAAYHAHIGALMRASQWSEARACLDDALHAMRDYPLGEVHLHSLRVRLALRMGNLDAARERLRTVIERADRLPHGLHRSHLALLRAEVAHRAHDRSTANQWTERAYQNARETGHQGNQLRALLAHAQRALACDDSDLARTYMQRAESYDSYRSVLPFAASWMHTEATLAAHSIDDNESASYAVRRYLQARDTYLLMGDSLSAAQATLASISPADHLNAPPLELPDALNEAADAFTNARRPDEAAQAARARRRFAAATPAADHTPLFQRLGHLARACAESAPTHASIGTACSHFLQADDRVRGLQLMYRPRHARASCRVADIGHTDTDTTTTLSYPTTEEPRLKLTLHTTAPIPDLSRAITIRLPVVLMALDRVPSSHGASSVASSSVRFPDAFIAESTAMQTLKRHIQRVHASHSPVLVTGEPGAGKALAARAVHAVSERRTHPLHTVEGGALQQHEWAAHLFGRIENGMYTPGVFDQADGGSVLLKAVHRIPRSVQDQLLRMLNTGCMFPVGSDSCRHVDVRLLATAPWPDDAPPETAMRPELAHRLGIITLQMPSLRHRREDIPVLVRHLLNTLRAPQTPLATITQQALDALMQYEWPGNVRQLRNEIERAFMAVRNEPTPHLTLDVFSAPIRESQSTEPPATHPYDALLNNEASLDGVLAQTEKAAIEHVLRAHDGHISASADTLGISRQGLYKKMKRLDIDAQAVVASS